MLNYKDMLEKINSRMNANSLSASNASSASVTVKISDIDELKELFGITPQVVESVKKSKGSADPGAVITRNIITGKMDKIPDDVPVEVTMTAADNLEIPDNAQWVLPAGERNTISIHTLTLGKGASIKSEYSVFTLTVENLKRESVTKETNPPIGKFIKNTKSNYDIGIFGTKGANIPAADDGKPGDDGAAGSGAKCGGGGGTPIGGKDAANGGNGKDGSDGANGKRGNNGNPSMITVLTFKDIDKSVENIAVYTYSGEGGDGANGGKGGNGGNGGKGGAGKQCACTGMDAANGGNGGKGGNGGDGGKGGDGVNGEKITINIPMSFNENNILINSKNAAPGKGGIAGLGGEGGKAGIHGEAGSKHSDEGSDGKHGENGKPGKNGEDGSVSGMPGEVEICKIKFD